MEELKSENIANKQANVNDLIALDVQRTFFDTNIDENRRVNLYLFRQS